MQTVEMREKTFNIRMSAEETERLEAVATHHGLTAASVIRMLVKHEAEKIGFKPSATPAAKPSKKTTRTK